MTKQKDSSQEEAPQGVVLERIVMQNKEDDWYEMYHRENETDDFLEWWVNYYGNPSDYEDTEEEQDEYWTRRAFALLGFRAAKSLHA